MSEDLFDPVASSDYVHRFEKEVRGQVWTPVEEEEVYRAAAGSPLTLIGEFHALPSAVRTAANVLKALHQEGVRPVLGLEMIHARDQVVLERYAEGFLSEKEFKRRIRYREEWGYPWKDYAGLLSLAIDLRLPVFGLDTPPRGGVEDLAFRDRITAWRLGHLRERLPENARMVVVFGEAHLAEPHLPLEIATVLPDCSEPVRIFHDLSPGESWSKGWKQGKNGCFLKDEVKPEQKDRALRRVIDRWSRECPEPGWFDYPLAVHGIIQTLAGKVGVGLRRTTLGPGRLLVDMIPRVAGPEERALAKRILIEEASPAAHFLKTAEAWGAAYDPQANLLHLARPSLSPVLVAGALFLLAAFEGRIYNKAPEPPESTRRREALALAWARLADPRLDLTPYPMASEALHLDLKEALASIIPHIR